MKKKGSKDNLKLSFGKLNTRGRLLFNQESISRRLAPVGITAQICINIGCNAECIMCDKRIFDKRGGFSYDQILDILKDLDTRTVSQVKLLGGEPTLDKEGLLKVAKECHKGGFYLKFNTNGAKLDKNYIDLLVKQGIKEINLSIDAVGDLHDRIRGIPGLFKHLEKIVIYIKNKYPRVKIKAQTVMMKINYDNIPGLVQWADSHGIYSLTLTKLQDYNKGYGELALTERKISLLLKKISKLNIRMKLDRHSYEKGIKKCSYLLHSLNINNQRKIIPCNKSIENSFTLDAPIRDLYRAPEFNNFILNLLKNCNRCHK